MKPLVIGLLVVVLTVAVYAQFGPPGQTQDGGREYGLWSMMGGFLLLSVLAGRRRGTDYRVVYGNFTNQNIVQPSG